MELKKLIILLLACTCTYAYGQRAQASNNTPMANYARVYATFNANPIAYTSGRVTISNGNLTYTQGSAGDGSLKSTLAITGVSKIYVEMTISTMTATTAVGIQNAESQTFDMPGRCSCEWAYQNDGQKLTGGVASAYGASYTSGDIIGIALDLNAGTLVFYKNGSSQGTAFSGLSGIFWFKVGSSDADPNTVITANFGATAFTYTVPGGFTSGLYIY